jgi:3-oxoacyl-[acyl-carrier-protein] synthase-3
MTIRSVVKGCGSYLPKRVVTNNDLAREVDTSDEWITRRTGIRQRHIAADGEKTSDLAFEAARRALASARMGADEIDLIVVATSTPDRTFPASATTVQAKLGMTRGAAFDVQAVCAGFVYALNIADSAIRLGEANAALVIGAETFSRILDWHDRSTCVLFGDGAGAVVLHATEASGTAHDRGILTCRLHSDGRFNDILYVDGGPSSTGTVGHLRMEGKEVFRHAVVNLVSATEESLAAAGLTSADIDWLVPHQANLRIMAGVAERLHLPESKLVVTVDHHANTSAASIPLALCEAVSDGRIKQSDVVVMQAIGGGLAWGASVIRW